ncbi:MAG: hypothetical protein AB1657_06105 [Candidatus Micrarchaeota archaeon]
MAETNPQPAKREIIEVSNRQTVKTYMYRMLLGRTMAERRAGMPRGVQAATELSREEVAAAWEKAESFVRLLGEHAEKAGHREVIPFWIRPSALNTAMGSAVFFDWEGLSKLGPEMLDKIFLLALTVRNNEGKLSYPFVVGAVSVLHYPTPTGCSVGHYDDARIFEFLFRHAVFTDSDKLHFPSPYEAAALAEQMIFGR